ncbi:dCTP deaminase [Allorhodopirellula heiligendammensis]|uniref:Deoxycytidine triphosphate deaminase n=1 Tax=Allorhodopirellula heiligendammensis TaxID=2714739 RepID=A0A5C6C9R0_9BACT|nr:Deoxycytidine triphosphate deaminase [Allorhodopirellula heiligendammensis]
MFFSADQISDQRSQELFGIEPFEPALLKSASYVLRLGNRVRRWRRQDTPIDLMTEDCAANSLGSVETVSEICVKQGDLLLVSSYESLWLPNGLAGFLSTTSHMSRAGISVTCDSQLISPGYGQGVPSELTFEIVSHNPSPVILHHGMPVCHLMLAPVSPQNREIALMRSIYEHQPVPSGPSMFEEMQHISKVKFPYAPKSK